MKAWLEDLDHRMRLAEALQCLAFPPHVVAIEDIVTLMSSLNLPASPLQVLHAQCVLRLVRLPGAATALQAADSLNDACLKAYGTFGNSSTAPTGESRPAQAPGQTPSMEAERQALQERVRALEFELEACTEIASQMKQREGGFEAERLRLEGEVARERARRSEEAGIRGRDLMLLKGRNVELSVELRTTREMLRAERARFAEREARWREREAALRAAEMRADRARGTWVRRNWRLAAGASCLQGRLLELEALALGEAEKLREQTSLAESSGRPPHAAALAPGKPSPARSRTASDSFWSLDLIKGVVQQGGGVGGGGGESGGGGCDWDGGAGSMFPAGAPEQNFTS